MRLINTSTIELQDFSLSAIPPYAILSHTWGDDEVIFQDLCAITSAGRRASSKKGFSKIEQTCRLGRRHGYDFVWIDTCCIDKSSSAELTESINSMFQWYRNAAVCYVFLQDHFAASGEDELARCRWFSRGWTLQELLAPKRVEFYDRDWKYRGTKLDFIHTISNFTRIPRQVLKGDIALADYSMASRMSWASYRQTTRIEDMAYCLLGIFGVNMPLIYGEGMGSFRRLQEEIVKRNNDLTIFAWQNEGLDQSFLGLFAPTPRVFADSAGVMPFSDDLMDFSITNKGLLVSSDAPLRVVAVTAGDGSEIIRYAIFLGQSSTMGGIYLRKMGPKLFCRDGSFALAGFGSEVDQINLIDATGYYIVIDPKAAMGNTTMMFRHRALHIPSSDTFALGATVPEVLWDASDRVFLRPNLYGWTGYPTVIAMKFEGVLAGQIVRLVVVCDYRSRDEVPTCKVFRQDRYQCQEAKIFEGRNRNESIYWADLEFEELGDHDNYVDIRVGKSIFRVLVSFEEKIVESISSRYEVFSLCFTISMSR
jgi:hypothetical protein